MQMIFGMTLVFPNLHFSQIQIICMPVLVFYLFASSSGSNHFISVIFFNIMRGGLSGPLLNAAFRSAWRWSMSWLLDLLSDELDLLHFILFAALHARHFLMAFFGPFSFDIDEIALEWGLKGMLVCAFEEFGMKTVDFFEMLAISHLWGLLHKHYILV